MSRLGPQEMESVRWISGLRVRVREKAVTSPERVRRALTYWAERLALNALRDWEQSDAGNQPGR